MPSLLDVLVERELRSKATIRKVPGGSEVGVDGLAKLISFSCPHPDEDLERFSIWCAKPVVSPESAVREIRDRKSGGRTLGYIFPMTSFSPDSEFSAERLEGRFIRVFASVAAIAIAMAGVANERVVRSFVDLPESLPLRELFQGDLAIVVVGRENMTMAGTSEEQVRLLVQELGYFVADLPHEYAWVKPAPEFGLQVCSVGRVSSHISDSCQLLERLTCLAAEQTSAVASLLIYYQVIELLSDRLLVARLTRLAAAPPTGSWEFREAVREAVSESSRVTSLCTQAAVGDDGPVFQSLQRLGLEILLSTNKPKEKGGPGAVLYAVRNLVVHNQAALPAEIHGLLNRFVLDLHAAVFAMVRRFDPTAAQ